MLVTFVCESKPCLALGARSKVLHARGHTVVLNCRVDCVLFAGFPSLPPMVEFYRRVRPNVDVLQRLKQSGLLFYQGIHTVVVDHGILWENAPKLRRSANVSDGAISGRASCCGHVEDSDVPLRALIRMRA